MEEHGGDESLQLYLAVYLSGVLRAELVEDEDVGPQELLVVEAVAGDGHEDGHEVDEHVHHRDEEHERVDREGRAARELQHVEERLAPRVHVLHVPQPSAEQRLVREGVVHALVAAELRPPVVVVLIVVVVAEPVDVRH